MTTDHTNTETQVLGSMLTSTPAIDDVTGTIEATDYANPRHEIIHNTITNLVEAGKPVDPTSVADALAAAGDLNKVGGIVYLHDCVNSVVTPASAGYHATLIRSAAMRRKVSSLSHRLAQISERDGDPLEVVNTARAELDNLIEGRQEDVSNEQASLEALEAIDRPAGDPTPWSKLNKAIGGWRKGALYIVGARPGVGKSAFAITVAVDSARRGKTSVVFSMEMLRNELYHRMYSSIGNIPGGAIQSGKLTKAEWNRAAEAQQHVANLPLAVFDQTQQSLAQIRAKVKSEQRKGEVGVVVVDYLSLVKAPPGYSKHDRRVVVDGIAQGLKNLAMDLQVPMIVPAQLNRGVEGRAEPVPTLSDLRESGGIEAAADVAILMHRDIMNAPNDLSLVVAKNRHGGPAKINLVFDGEFSQIRELENTWADGNYPGHQQK